MKKLFFDCSSLIMRSLALLMLFGCSCDKKPNFKDDFERYFSKSEVNISSVSPQVFKIIYTNYIQNEIIPLIYSMVYDSNIEKIDKHINVLKNNLLKDKYSIFMENAETINDFENEVKTKHFVWFSYDILNHHNYENIKLYGTGFLNENKLIIRNIVYYDIKNLNSPNHESTRENIEKIEEYLKDEYEQKIIGDIINNINVIDLSNNINVYLLSWPFIEYTSDLISTMKQHIMHDLEIACENNTINHFLIDVQNVLYNSNYSRMFLSEVAWDLICDFENSIYLYELKEYYGYYLLYYEIGFTNKKNEYIKNNELLLPISKKILTYSLEFDDDIML